MNALLRRGLSLGARIVRRLRRGVAPADLPKLLNVLRAEVSIQTINAMQPEAVSAFVKKSDELGGPDSTETAAYWKGLRFDVPAAIRAEAEGLDPVSDAYAALQDRIYRALTGGDHRGQASEHTAIDKEQALASPLAYPGRSPKDLNRYLLAHARFAEQFDSDTACDVLEVGSGWGFSTEYLARLGHRVTAVEINPDFVEVARRRSAKAGLGVDYHQGSFEELPLDPGRRFDVVYCFEAFHHARDTAATMRRLAGRLKPKGQFILFGEPLIEPAWWPSWGLRLDPLSIYCIAKFGWWESGWTFSYLAWLFRAAGLELSFVDFNTDLERYLVGRPGNRFEADQLSWRPEHDGWARDGRCLVSTGRSRIEFRRPLKQATFEIENHAPFQLQAVIESAALSTPSHAVLSPGANRLSIPLDRPQAGGWDIRIAATVWNPHRALGGNAEDRDLSFHLVAVEETPA